MPLGNLSHFHEPTRSYWDGLSPPVALAWARSTVTRTCVSTRDFVPPSGMLGTIIARLSSRKVSSLGGNRIDWKQRTLNTTPLEGIRRSVKLKDPIYVVGELGEELVWLGW